MAMFMIDLGAPSFYSLLGLPPDADASSIRAGQTRKAAELSRARDKTSDPTDKRRLEEQLITVNGIGDTLANPQRREVYNARNAHLTFFIASMRS